MTPMETKNPIWFCIPRTICWLTQARDTAGTSLDSETRAGINYSIILNAACLVEGTLESGLRALVEAVPHGDEPLHDALKKELMQRISRTTGIREYSVLVGLIVGVPACALTQVKPLWEAVTMLFDFRNVLAHGRAISSKLTFPSLPDSRWHEDIVGNYANVREYLSKKQILPKAEPIDSEWLLLSDEIAHHFWEVAPSFISAVGDSLSEASKAVFKTATQIPALFLPENAHAKGLLK